MLDERQIERYTRQILLADVGPSGQRRLLAARVEIRGTGEASRLCAAWLAGAGIGHLSLPDAPLGEDPLVVRNPDCRLETGALGSADVRLGVGRLPGRPRTGCALLWARSSADSITWSRLGRRRGCESCRTALPGEGNAVVAHATLVSSLLATETIRLLLGLAPETEAASFRWDLARGSPDAKAFPFRRSCDSCRTTS